MAEESWTLVIVVVHEDEWEKCTRGALHSVLLVPGHI